MVMGTQIDNWRLKMSTKNWNMTVTDVETTGSVGETDMGLTTITATDVGVTAVKASDVSVTAVEPDEVSLTTITESE